MKMKKVIILLFTLLVSGGLFAQMPNFGLKAGATASSLNTTDIQSSLDSENLLGYQLGAFMRINTGKMYIQPEVLYNLRSTNIVGAAFVDDVFDVGTIDVPLLLGFKVLDAKVFNLRAFVGPEASFTLDKNIEGESGFTLDDINNLTWYMQAGVGIDLLFLTFDIRYEKGLSNFIDDYQSDGSFKNNVVVFSLGLKFM